ncbi:MAG: hypothetical protein ABIE47_05435, partial [Pseudomonadota bacterium]
GGISDSFSRKDKTMKNEVAIIDIIDKALAEYSTTPAKVAAMAKEYENLAVVQGDKKSYKAVHEAKMILTRTRTGVDKRRKELGEDARGWVNAVNQAAKDLLAPIVPIENRFKDELQAEDNRIAKIEADRIAAIKAKIEFIREKVVGTASKTSIEIASLMEQVDHTQIMPEVFQEFQDEALKAKSDTISTLVTVYEDKLEAEKKEAELNVMVERLEKLRKEQEAEATRQAEEKRKVEEAQRKLEEGLAKLEAEKKAEQARIEREAFEKQALENARIQAEKDAKEKEEAAAKEKARQEALKPDKEKLDNFAIGLTAIIMPHVESQKAKEVVLYASGQLANLAEEICKRAEAL